jgi:hypothetical protein
MAGKHSRAEYEAAYKLLEANDDVQSEGYNAEAIAVLRERLITAVMALWGYAGQISGTAAPGQRDTATGKQAQVSIGGGYV